MTIKTIVLGSDHGAIELRESIQAFFKDNHPEIAIVDLGTHTSDSVDYPDFADLVCQDVLNGKADAGILCCGTGIGISIRANRYKGIRAALVYDDFSAEMAKAHNNANILCFGERTMDTQAVLQRIQTWLTTDYEGGRHQRRLDKLDR